ncbi:hypothetical protein BGZ65_005618 [Modicella reniformis]|uniref:Uncharacterized protein n=1 Tax=Modicella reniformis TaxID=1440133 RepID=A0A9P6IJR9_9FUNG|nr:hypothetical protein BGZ65_005618 [Modicella reniformis]
MNSETLKAVCGLLNPLFLVPGTDTLEKILSKSVREKAMKLKDYINNNVIKDAITADSWTSIDNNRKYFGITFHFITPEWDLQTKLICGTTDEGANTKKAMHLFSRHITIEWIPCSAHIQLCIHKAINKTSAAKALLDKCQKISTLFKNSGAALRLLNKELPGNATRWNSHFTMAERVHQTIEAIPATLDKMKTGTTEEKAKAQGPRTTDA